MLGSIIPGWNLFSGLIGLGAFLLVAWLVYENFLASPKDLTSAQQKCLDKILPQVASDVRQFADAHGLYGVNVARFRNDTPNAHITAAVRATIGRQEGIVLKQRDSIGAELRKAIQGAMSEDGTPAQAKLDLDGREQAMKYVAATEGLGFVVFGETDLEKDGDNAAVGITLYLQGAKPTMAFKKRYYLNTWDKQFDELPASAAVGSYDVGDVVWRLVVFLVVAFFFPIVTGPLAVYGFRLESNLVNFLILAFYTLFTGFLAWLLMGFAFGGWPLLLVLTAMVTGGFWNYRVCTVWEERA